MKTKALLACLFVAGVVASFAIASPPPGKGNPHNTSTGSSTGTSTGTATTPHGSGHAGKVALCHKTSSNSNPYVKIWVSKNAVKAHEQRGDLALFANGSCSKGSTPGHGGTTGTATGGTTTGTTTG